MKAATRGLKNRQLAMFVLLAASLIVIFYTLRPSLEEIQNTDFSGYEINITLAALCCLCTLLFKAWTHVLIFDKYRLPPGTGLHILAAYANGQLVRYIPGKVLGIISQSLKLSDCVRPALTWEANIKQYVLTNGVSVFVLVAFAAYFLLDSLVSALLLVLLSFIFIPIIARNRLTCIFNRLAKLFAVAPVETQTGVHSWKNASLVFLSLYLEWLFYFFAWFYLAGDKESLSFVYLGWLYAAASLLALLAVVVPNGLLVREAIFLWLGTVSGVSVEHLLFYSVLFRVLYILCEMLFYLITELLAALNSWVKK